MLKEFWGIYWKRILGVAAGFFFGIVYLIFGFWDMLFVFVLISLGYWYGKQKELTDGPIIPWRKLWDGLMERFRPFR